MKKLGLCLVQPQRIVSKGSSVTVSVAAWSGQKSIWIQRKYFIFIGNNLKRLILNWSQKHQVGVVFLCGFFKILSAEFLEDCSSVFVNTHPSLLPAFPGLEKKVHREVFESVCLSGFSVHLVNASLDGGPIIFQHPVSIIGSEDVDESRARVRASEQRLLAPVLESVLKSQLKSEDRNLSTKKLHEKYNLGMTSFKEC